VLLSFWHLDISSKEIWIGVSWDGSGYSWLNGETEGLDTSSSNWSQVRGEPNRSGDCVNSFGLTYQYKLRDHPCDLYQAGYACEANKS